MLSNIYAAPPPAKQPASSPARNASDDNNKFSDALRGARDSQEQDDNKTDVKAPAIEPAGKKSDKKDDNNQAAVDNTAQPVPVPQPKTPPITAILGLTTFTQQPDLDAGTAATQTAAVTTAPVTTTVNNQSSQTNLESLNIGDTKPAKATTVRNADNTVSMAVPVSLYPILQAPILWRAAVTNTATLTAPASQTSKAAKIDAGSASLNLIAADVPVPAIAADSKANAAATPATAGTISGLQTDSKPDPLQIPNPSAPEATAADATPKAMAFAMKLGSQTVQPAIAAQPAETPRQQIAPQSISGIVTPDQTTDSGGKSQSKDSGQGNGSAFASPYFEAAQVNRTTSDKAVFTDVSSAAKTAAPDDAAPQPASSDPLKNILLQLKSDDNRRVDVRLVDRGGELHVAVKSADPALTERLQQHMPELTSRLEGEHFTHEVWIPKLSEATRSETGSDSTNTSSGNGTNTSQTPNGEAGRRGNGQSQQQPDWVDLLENQLG